MTNWEGEAKQRGYSSEEEMWKDLYPQHSLTKLTVMFNKSINAIRARIDGAGIPMQKRGGANNQKVEITQELLEEVIAKGVHKVAKERGIQPQTLYQRLYYRFGIRVRDIKQKAEEAIKAAEIAPECGVTVE